MGIELGLSRLNAGPGGLFLCQVLVDLLSADGAAALHGTCAVGVCGGFRRIGLRFGQGSTRQRHIGLHALRRKGGQQLATFDAVAHIGMQLGDAQPVGLGAYACLLPCSNRAVGRQLDGQCAVGGLCQRNGECRLGGYGLGGVGGVAAGRPQPQAGYGKEAGNQEARLQMLVGQTHSQKLGVCVRHGLAVGKQEGRSVIG